MADTLLPPPPAHAPKAEWRAWAREVRAGLPDLSAEISAHLAAFLGERGVRCVLAYRALPGEPDVAALAGSFELLTTRARFRPEPRLTLHPWHTATEPSRFGALQPPADAPRVALDTVDAVLLPALAFDCRGVRLGYGGGFYDRLLPGFRGLTVGVVGEALVVDALPSEAHDLRIGFLATETGVRSVQP
ncbi:5-formyltetrahydrofolate cyclo-ligase [Deinococcus metallilatus]|uniref:5-formyltetrahydrofolate cyclo-ligase n=1 Tax=Deinococcus metallilatus TaxID=1211322 RepID=A0ABR6MZ88_9DEIO|nr:5-formyltetrahydrofolate cyclo-ligase [Deinococcus metallilatus]MBB5297260.1 5-formyltetrahydrofolate cyclo-ligase [Deinococcus metallilatus]GMA17203.1 5-formyltetrahydrofolate cyclo-ligase [Deinococcus metallilatus]